jgi:regulator of protease activity HflC (stomatin/prohibitin superfamily)
VADLAFYGAIIAIVAIFFVYNLVIIVPMRENRTLERLGTFRAILNPGWHIVVPFVDRIAYRHDIREQVIDIPSQSCITKDNIRVDVDGLVYLKVVDAKRASYGIGDYILASINLAQTTMRSEIGKLTLSETFAERENLNESIVTEIDKASDPWGVKVLSYEVKNITPSKGVVHTLEKQMEAERQRRADVILASAERESQILVSEGFRQEAINHSEGEKQRRINESKGRAREISAVAEATAQGVKLVAAAIQKPGGDLAVKMKLTEQFIKKVEKIIQNSSVSVFPLELATLKGAVDSLLKKQRSATTSRGGSKPHPENQAQYSIPNNPPTTGGF